MVPGLTSQQAPLTGARLRTPRAAAVAGIVFSVLLMSALVLLRLSVPNNPLETGRWLGTDAKRVGVALNLVPFAGIAFLWFIGVLRARLGDHEDRFFATVLLGSGLLFLAMLFSAAAIAGAVLLAYGAYAEALTESAEFTLVRALSHSIMNIYAVKKRRGFYGHDIHARYLHRNCGALDRVSRLCPRAPSPFWWKFH